MFIHHRRFATQDTLNRGLICSPFTENSEEPLAIVYRSENEKEDVNTEGGDYCIIGVDHNSGGADLDTSYQLTLLKSKYKFVIIPDT